MSKRIIIVLGGPQGRNHGETGFGSVRGRSVRYEEAWLKNTVDFFYEAVRCPPQTEYKQKPELLGGNVLEPQRGLCEPGEGGYQQKGRAEEAIAETLNP